MEERGVSSRQFFFHELNNHGGKIPDIIEGPSQEWLEGSLSANPSRFYEASCLWSNDHRREEWKSYLDWVLIGRRLRAIGIKRVEARFILVARRDSSLKQREQDGLELARIN